MFNQARLNQARLNDVRAAEERLVEQQDLKEQARQDPEIVGQTTEASEDQWAHERQHRAEDQAQEN